MYLLIRIFNLIFINRLNFKSNPPLSLTRWWGICFTEYFIGSLQLHNLIESWADSALLAGFIQHKTRRVFSLNLQRLRYRNTTGCLDTVHDGFATIRYKLIIKCCQVRHLTDYLPWCILRSADACPASEGFLSVTFTYRCVTDNQWIELHNV